MVPLISSLCYGPLGYCQMPRTWWKSLLHAHGLLAEDYPPCTDGLDHWWLEGFMIEDEEMLADWARAAFEAALRGRPKGGTRKSIPADRR